MSSPNFLIVVLVVVSGTLTSAFQKRDAGQTLFSVGKEYKYQYETLVTAGTEEPTSYASSYRLKGTLRVQGTAPETISAKLDDITIGLYNGPWSYFPVPEFQYFPTEDFKPLSEPFQIVTENGKFKTLIMNDQEPEWASNIKRGFATYLQMDLDLVHPTKLGIFKSSEVTTMGECVTNYEVLPASTGISGLGRVSKFRNHADCPDVPTRSRFATETFFPCQDKLTRDITNSTAYATYDISQVGGEITVQKLTVLSSILYWPFTTNGPFQYSWLNMTLGLDSVTPTTSPIPAPENAENHEDLTYVFEQSDLTDPEEEISDLKFADPLLFHHSTTDSDPETQEKLMQLCHSRVKEVAESLLNANVFTDTKQFHKSSPFAILPIIASLDYASLKNCHTRYSREASSGPSTLLEYQLFLDGLLISGTSATILVVRDILLESDDSKVINRLAPVFPHFIRHPTEALAKEMDSLFELTSKPKLSKSSKRIIEFSMATLISRCCKKTLCTTSGLLEKYITYFENKLAGSNHFEEQIAAILGLRNLGRGGALTKVLEIAEGKTDHENSVRIQAIWGLGFSEDTGKVFEALLPVFYNRSESCEVRTSVFKFLMGLRPNERILHEIAYFMWTETCPQTMNIVRSTLTVLSKSQIPCNPVGSYARTVLKYLPPGNIDPTRTTAYGTDYYDKTYGFGQMASATVQKSGSSALPVSIYIGLSGYMGGYSSHHVGIFIRLQGFGKAIMRKLSEMRQTDIEEIQNILASAKVEERPTVPLKLELTVNYGHRAVLYYAADEKSIISVTGLIRKLQGINKDLKLVWERSLLQGGIVHQQPLEIGTPVSIVAAVATIGAIEQKFPNIRPTNFEIESRIQGNLFGVTLIANHVPAIGTVHSVSAYRTLRLRLPIHLKFGIDTKKQEINFSFIPPKQSDPAIAQFHATTVTALKGDSPNQIKDEEAKVHLANSCPSCLPAAVVTRGDDFRKSRTLPLRLPSFIRGLNSGVKYFDCERDHSRAAVFKKIKRFFSDSDKNTGFFENPTTKILLGIQHAWDFLWISPYAETCGLKAELSQDESGSSKLTKVEGSVKSVRSAKKLSINSKLQLKYAGAESSVATLELLGQFEEKDVNTQELKLKLIGNDPVQKKHGVVVCVDVSNYAKQLTKDVFCVKGENEPLLKQSISIKIGKISPGDSNADIDSMPCLDNHVNVQITEVSKRSPEQILESDNAAVWPYQQCKAQKRSGTFPGNFVPPTQECYAALAEQSNLRTANVTINYKVAKEVQKRWRTPVLLIGGLLAPYATDPETENEHEHSSDHVHAPANANSGIYEGEVEVDVNIRKDSPTLNVHYTGSSGVEQHFHGVDLNLLPYQLKPFPSRISPIVSFGLKAGFLGQCSVSPNSVITFDSFTYPSQLSECPTLISADCGANPQYAVVARKSSQDKLAVDVYIGEQHVVLDGSEAPTVDGKPLNLIDQQVIDYEEYSFKMLKNGDEVYLVSFLQGVYIRYTGSFVSVSLGSRYRGVQCGVCGTWDSSPYNDLVGPQKCTSPLTPADMAKVYIVRRDTANAECKAIAKDCP